MKLDDGYYHEMMDRLHVVLSTINDHITSHKVCDEHDDIKSKMNEAEDILAEAYQMVGKLTI